MAATVAATAALAAPAAAHQQESYDHVGTFDVPENLLPGEPADAVTSAEIVAAVPGGRTLVYTDSPAERIGFVDISRPSRPEPGGALPMGGEPTSVATVGRYALVAVNTSEDFANPSGDLAVVDTRTHAIVRRVALAGQPDSVAVSPDHRYAAVVIENERDEDVDDGLIPQAPPGSLQVVDLARLVLGWGSPVRTVDLTGLADYAPSDPEPEFVDVNRRNEAVVSLQENNHLAIVDLRRAKVTRDFSAGSATVRDADATEDGDISLDETLTKRREPDAVHWVDDDTFATANEGDYTDESGEEGGSRGFTLFSSKGKVEWESGSSFEREVVRAGHFPEARAENKGVEPEGLEVVRQHGRTFLFVGAERANVVGVYEIERGKPEFRHVLATGIGPEGIRAIPERGLLAVSAETDGVAEGFPAIRPVVTLYQLRRGEPSYPQLLGDAPWTAQSGLSGDPRSRNTMWSVSDSALATGWLYKIDVGRAPALITKRIAVKAQNLDLEGVAARKDGGFWLAGEGNASRPNRLLRTDGAGNVLDSVELPAALTAGATTSGFEGVTVTGSGSKETVYAVIQREWADDPKGFVKLARYEVAAKRWTFARYPLDAVESPAGGWVGLSEISLMPDGRHVAITERDDRIAGAAQIKRLYSVDLGDVVWREFGQPLVTVRKALLRDVLDELDERSITVPDKLEGAGFTADGRLFLATDNDGVDENFGETLFFRPGSSRRGYARR